MNPVVICVSYYTGDGVILSSESGEKLKVVCLLFLSMSGPLLGRQENRGGMATSGGKTLSKIPYYRKMKRKRK